MTVKYRTPGAWGAGSLANLTPVEVDTNFYDTAAAVTNAEAETLSAGGISAITQPTERTLAATVDGDSWGPWTLPGATMRLRGTWVGGDDYYANDLVKIGDTNLYLVTRDHTADTEFDPQAEDSEGLLYIRMLGNSERYDLAVYIPGLIGAYAGPVYSIVAPQNLYVVESDTLESCGVIYARIAPAAETIYHIQKNGVDFGVATLAPGEHLGDVECDTSTAFVAGDRLTILAPTPDITGADVSITINTVRGHLP